MRKWIVVVALMFAGAAGAAPPVHPAYRTNSLLMLQPEPVLRARVSSVENMAAYIRALQGAAGTVLAREPASTPSNGYLLVAVRPDGRSKLWFDFKPALPAQTQERLRASLEAVRPFQPKGGVVVFALNTSLWGAREPQFKPAPAEWTQAAQRAGGSLETGALIDRIWPATPAR